MRTSAIRNAAGEDEDHDARRTPGGAAPMSREELLGYMGHAETINNITPPSYHEDTPAPSYAACANAVAAGWLSLSRGDPNEVISVPMIHSRERVNYRKLFSSSSKHVTITRSVVVRKMPRYHYLQHYAKDADGNYVGTGKRAADAGLVFVPSKATPEDILKQVQEVAFGKMHNAQDFGTKHWVPAGAYGGS